MLHGVVFLCSFSEGFVNLNPSQSQSMRDFPLIVLPVLVVAGHGGEHGGGADALAVHPEDLVPVTGGAVGREAVGQPAMLIVPGPLHSHVEEVAGLGHAPDVWLQFRDPLT